MLYIWGSLLLLQHMLIHFCNSLGNLWTKLKFLTGTLEKRGIIAFRQEYTDDQAEVAGFSSIHCYDFPFGMSFIRRWKWTGYIPLCPTFFWTGLVDSENVDGGCCPTCFDNRREKAAVTSVSSDVDNPVWKSLKGMIFWKYSLGKHEQSTYFNATTFQVNVYT